MKRAESDQLKNSLSVENRYYSKEEKKREKGMFVKKEKARL